MKMIADNIKKIFYLVGNNKKSFPIIIIAFLIISILELISIGIIIPYISFVLNGNTSLEFLDQIILQISNNLSNTQLVLYFGFLIFFVYLIKSVSAIGINFLIISFSAKVQAELKNFLIKKYLRMPYSIFLSNNSAEYINNTHNLTSTFTDNVLTPFLKLVSELLVITFIGFGLILISPIGVLLFVSIILIPIIIYDRIIKIKLKKYGIDIANANKYLIKNISESINGIKEIRILKKEKFFEQAVSKNALILADSNRFYQFFALIPKYLFELSLILFVVLFISLSFLFLGNETNLITMIAVFGVAAMRLLPSLSYVNASINSIRFGSFALSKLFDDMNSMSQFNFDNYLEDKLENNRDEFLNIEIRNINFSYPNKDIIFKNTSFCVNRGDYIGILGKSGSGKTTFLNLLLGLLEPRSGEILLNGKKIKHGNSLKDIAAYISQTNFIIDDTLRKNIIFDEKINPEIDKKIINSLYSARLKDFYIDLEDGLDTILGESGLKISGGQRQRIALARTFFHERELIIMDEATNSLDKDTEIRILKELKELKGSSSLILVSHDMETLKYCDKIYEIRDKNIFKF